MELGRGKEGTEEVGDARGVGQRRVEKGRGKRCEWGVQGICTAWAGWGGGGSVRSNCRAWFRARQVQEGQGSPGTVPLLRRTLSGDPGYPGGR